MPKSRSFLRHAPLTFFAVLSFAVIAFAQEEAAAPASSAEQQVAVSNVRIKNFGQMDERFYRGAQPKEEQYAELKALGITTVIDLQAEPKEYERRIVESLGMRYVNIPMVEKTYPRAEHVEEFLKLTADASTGKFFVHCAGGRHRTGSMGAVYRFNNYGWDFDQVYKEMKDFDFYTRWGHGDFKKFVQDYWQRKQSGNAAAQLTTAASTGRVFTQAPK